MNQSRQRILRGARPDAAPAAEPVDPAAADLQRFEAARAAYVDVVRERVAIGVEELHRVVADRAGTEVVGPDAGLIDDVELDLFDDPAAPVTMLHPDVVVHAPALTAGIVLTHRLSAAERAADHLDVEPDLAGFLRVPDLRVAAGPLHWDEPDDDGPVRWGGPAGWLSDLPQDALLAVRLGADGEVTLAALETDPAVTPEQVAALRAVYDDEVAEPWLPVPAESLVLGMLHRGCTVFGEPRPPLGEIAAAAGLERRGGEYAHDESVWATAEQASRDFRLVMGLESEEQTEAAVAAFDLLAADPHDPAVLRQALGLLDDPEVLGAVTEELLLEPDEDGHRVRSVAALADRLLAAAGRSPREAIARWLAAVAAERDGRVLDAESHLRAASLAAEDWPLVEDRLAWYESDRGDAAAAAARWRAIEVPADDPDLVVAGPFATATGPEPGRNDPCWCGSGRKYKQCHRGRPAHAPLPDRAPWLYRKAVTYLERRGGAAATALDEWEYALAAGYEDPEAWPEEAFVADVVLSEGGWFARFLADRGPLLPADEAELAASWADVRRTVYEVERVRFGSGATLRDLRSGATVEVEASAVGGDLAMGELLLARALPDGSGTGHLLVGGLLGVQRGTEDDLLEMLAAGSTAADDTGRTGE